MTVPRGASRLKRRTHPSRLSWVRGFLPSWSCEFDFRHPLQSKMPGQRHIGISNKHCRHSTLDISIFQAGHVRSTFFPGLADKCPCHTHFLRPQSVAIQGTKPRFRAIAGPLQLPLTWKVASSRPRHNRVDGLKQGIGAANLAPAACFRRALPGLDQAQLPRRGIDHAGWIFCAHHPPLAGGDERGSDRDDQQRERSSACSGR
jgi:hypothetical protein